MALYGHPELMEIPPAVRRRRCALVPARPSMSKTREPRVLKTVATSTHLRLRDERLLRTAEGRSMDTLIERCAGLDVHKDTVVACVRVPARGGGREQSIQTFGTTTAQLLALRDWLVAHGVTRVGMESTGVYWKPVYYVLEDAVECWLLNARHLHNVPGRKTDVADAAWICQLVEHGLVRPSFVPPRPIRELRNLTRYRKAQIEERTREAQRLDKILQDAGVELASVASDILGVSGRAMLTAVVEGTRYPEVLAELAKGKPRKGSKWLRTALVEGAKAAARSKGTYLAAQHARLKGRRGSRKATIAVGHSILVATYHMLDQGLAYHDLGADHFVRHDPKLH